MHIISTLQHTVAQAVQALYGESFDASKVQINPTPAEFSGDYSVVIFPIVKWSKKAPDATATEIGTFLQENVADIVSFNVVKGFLNLEISGAYWQQFLQAVVGDPAYGHQPSNGQKVMVEYSSPNTNKPLHLGHIRNILLGWSCSQILEAVGYEVIKVQIINDRGVAICKSMASWELFGEGKTPENSGIKGDHLVGDFYVLFEQKTKAEYEEWQKSDSAKALFEGRKKTEQSEKDFFKDFKNKWFNEYSKLGAVVRDMLIKWENHDPKTLALWKQMNNWVYDGFNKTYCDLGVSFDKLYYESDTYLLGKDIVDEGLTKGVFFKKEDGSVWVDLTDVGQDQKVILRSDGTSMYITQDLGTARMRYADFGCERAVYVVADEQNYHFQVLFEVLKRLGDSYASGLYHLSYGLVELPTGRMKTREGTVVDADDLIAEVIRLAETEAESRGNLAAFSESERADMIHKIGLSALKYLIIKVHPHKKMIFNPEESVSLEGQTGPYIQYSFVRTNGLNKYYHEVADWSPAQTYTAFEPSERDLLRSLHEYPALLLTAAKSYDPSLIANFCYDLAKKYSRFWHDVQIIRADSEAAKLARLQLSRAVGQVLQSGMKLLGIEMPERM